MTCKFCKKPIEFQLRIVAANGMRIHAWRHGGTRKMFCENARTLAEPAKATAR